MTRTLKKKSGPWAARAAVCVALARDRAGGRGVGKGGMGGRRGEDPSGDASGHVEVKKEAGKVGDGGSVEEGEEDEWVWTAPVAPTEEEVRQTEELLGALEEYQPMLPDALMQQCLKRAGFTTTDKRVMRLVAVAAQKFVTDVASGAMAACKVRQAREAREVRSKGKKAEADAGQPADGQQKRYVMTVEDLSQSLGDYGINVRKRPYFVDPTER
jgi:transcription initiation factor TFIID subunit 10